MHVIVLTAGLGPRGYETRLLVGQTSEREGDLHNLAETNGVRCIQVQGLGREIRPWADLLVLARLYRTIREFRPAIVHTHTAKAGFVGRVAAWLAGVPVIVHTFHGHVLRGYFGVVKTMFYRRLERGLARRTHVILAVSAAVKNDLVSLGVAPADKIRVIPLGLPLAPLAGDLPKGRLRSEYRVPAGVPFIGAVGRLVPIKDLATFLHAAALVLREVPDAHFALVGDGELRHVLEAKTRELGLAERVHFYGWREDMTQVYGDLDVVVNCSRNEGTPVALIEAMASGTPVIATAVGGTPDLLGDGQRGGLVPAGDPVSLAAAIVRTLRSPAPERLAAARHYALAHHSVDRLLADIDGLYRQLLARAEPG